MPRVSPVEYSGQTVTLSVLSGILPNFVGLEVYELGQECWLVAEIIDQIIPKRQSRVNPRVVKKTGVKIPFS